MLFNSDYIRYSDKKCIVIQNVSSVNIFNMNTIGFYLDMTNEKVLQIFVNLFLNKFTNIIFDWSTTKFFKPSQLCLPYDRILTNGGHAFMDISVFGGCIPFSNPYFEESYQNFINNRPDCTRAIMANIFIEANKIYSNISIMYDSIHYNDLKYEICSKINAALGYMKNYIMIDKEYSFNIHNILHIPNYSTQISQKLIEKREINILEHLHKIKDITIEIVHNDGTRPYPIPAYNDIRDTQQNRYISIMKNTVTSQLAY